MVEAIFILEELQDNQVTVKYMELEKKTILPCKECYVCQEVEGTYGCAQKDDMPAISGEWLSGHALAENLGHIKVRKQ